MGQGEANADNAIHVQALQCKNKDFSKDRTEEQLVVLASGHIIPVKGCNVSVFTTRIEWDSCCITLHEALGYSRL